MWHDMATVNGVPFIMRDVTLWAFTVPFFEDREDELKEFEGEMATLPMSVEAYLAQLHVIQSARHHRSLGGIRGYPVLVMAGEEDILIPVSTLQTICRRASPGRTGRRRRGVTQSMWEHPAEFNRTYLGWLGEHA